MKHRWFVILSLGIVLLFAFTSCASGAGNTSREEKIRALVQTSLYIQYEHKTADLEQVFTKEFLSGIPDNFYKDDLAPCVITNYDFMTTLTETDDGQLVVAVRVEDKQGGYIQVMHMIKSNESYLIGTIEYDI